MITVQMFCCCNSAVPCSAFLNVMGAYEFLTIIRPGYIVAHIFSLLYHIFYMNKISHIREDMTPTPLSPREHMPLMMSLSPLYLEWRQFPL